MEIKNGTYVRVKDWRPYYSEELMETSRFGYHTYMEYVIGHVGQVFVANPQENEYSVNSFLVYNKEVTTLNYENVYWFFRGEELEIVTEEDWIIESISLKIEGE